MRWNEQIQADLAKLKQLETKKEKWHFLWDYYRTPFLVCVLIVVILGGFLIRTVFAPKPLFYAVFLNSDAAIVECDPSVLQKEAEKAGLNSKKAIDVNDYLHLGEKKQEEEDMQTRQVLLALFSMGELDLFVCEEEYFEAYAKEGAFIDLSGIEDVKDIVQKSGYSVILTEDGSKSVCGIWLDENSPLHQAGYFHKPVLAGICAQGDLQENALAFLKQIAK